MLRTTLHLARIVSALFIQFTDGEVHIKAFVTGASGHLGYHICKLLASEGFNVRAFVRPSSFIGHLSLLPLEINFGSILDAESVREAMRGMDVVFHTAAVYQLTETRRRPGRIVNDPIVRTAVEGTKNIYAAALENNIEKIIYTSSVETIGLTRDKNKLLDEFAFSEDDFYIYTTAKIQSERIALGLAETCKLPTVVCNPSTIIGKDDYKPTPSNQMLLNLARFSAFCVEGGQSLIDVEDVARGHLGALKFGKPRERYILSGENIEMRDLIGLIRKHLNRKGPVFELGKVLLYPAALALEKISRMTGKNPFFTCAKVDRAVGSYSFFDNNKAITVLGYRPQNLETTLPSTLSWLLKKYK